MNNLLRSSTGKGLSLTITGLLSYLLLQLNQHYGLTIAQGDIAFVVEQLLEIGLLLTTAFGLIRKVIVFIENKFGLQYNMITYKNNTGITKVNYISTTIPKNMSIEILKSEEGTQVEDTPVETPEEETSEVEDTEEAPAEETPEEETTE